MNITNKQMLLISELYDASMNQDLWGDILDQLASEIGAKGSALLSIAILNQYQYSVNKASSLFSEQVKSKYELEFAKYEETNFAAVANSPAGVLVYDAEYLRTPKTFANRPDVAFLREQCGIYERIAIRLTDEKAWFDCLTFQYDQSRGNITQPEQDLLKVFLPHVSRTISLSKAFNILKMKFNAILSVLDKYHIGVFLVSQNMDIVLSNKTAQEIANKGRAIKISNTKQLAINDREANGKLCEAVARASLTAKGQECHESVVIPIPKGQSFDYIYSDVSPIRDTFGEIDGSFKGAIVNIVDPDYNHQANVYGLQELYGLTKAESLVANIFLKGKSYSDIADIRNVSPETVKSQVRSILSKTSSRNRTEFIHCVLSINPPIDNNFGVRDHA